MVIQLKINKQKQITPCFQTKNMIYLIYGPDKASYSGQRDSIGIKVLVLHVADLGLIPGNIWFTKAPMGAIPDHRTGSILEDTPYPHKWLESLD